MRMDDLITTGRELEERSNALASDKATDAVTSGIVDSADKSGMAIKRDPFKGDTHGGTGRRGILADGTDADMMATSRGAERGIEGQDPLGSSSPASGNRRQLLSARNARKGLQASALHKSLEGTEFEGADDYYYRAKGVAKLGKKGASKTSKALKKRDEKRSKKGKTDVSAGADTDKKLGGLSEKKYTKKKSPQELQRRMQSLRNQRQAMSTAASASNGGLLKSATAKGAGTMAGAASSGTGTIFGVLGGSLAPVLGVVVAGFLCVALIGGIAGSSDDDNEDANIDGMTSTEATVATSLKEDGFSNETIAAVLGNMKQESDVKTGTDGDDGYGTTSLGLVQMTGTERLHFLQWCSKNNKKWNSATVQIEWTFSNHKGTSDGYYVNRWTNYGAQSWRGYETYYCHERGYEHRFKTECITKKKVKKFKTCKDVDLATYSWMSCYERPGSKLTYNDDVSRLNKRLAYAHSYLKILNSSGTTSSTGSGADYSSASKMQKKIANQCKIEVSTLSGQCAKWTNNVYQHATGKRPSTNANDEYFKYCKSSDRKKLKVGMLVASGPHVGHQGRYRNGAGNATGYGHIGIYVGDGKVMHSTGGSVHTDSLDAWIKSFTVKDVNCGKTMTVKWGFPPWVK